MSATRIVIIVTPNDGTGGVCPHLPIKAVIDGETRPRAVGFGSSVEAAVEDMFTARRANELARSLELLAAKVTQRKGAAR